VYCTPALFSRQCHCNTALYRCTAHRIIQHTVSLEHSNLSLYFTKYYSEDSDTVAQQSVAVLHTALFSKQCLSNTVICRCTAQYIMQQTVPLYHSNLSLYCTTYYSADSATVAQQTIAVLHNILFSRLCQCITAIYCCTAHRIIQHTAPLFKAIYRCTAHHIIQQTVPL